MLQSGFTENRQYGLTYHQCTENLKISSNNVFDAQCRSVIIKAFFAKIVTTDSRSHVTTRSVVFLPIAALLYCIFEAWLTFRHMQKIATLN